MISSPKVERLSSPRENTEGCPGPGRTVFLAKERAAVLAKERTAVLPQGREGWSPQGWEGCPDEGKAAVLPKEGKAVP